MKALDPNKYDSNTYSEELLKLNRERIVETQARLEQSNFSGSISSIVNILGGKGDDIHIYPMLVGSDGRLEKGAHSPDDLMIYIAGSNLSPSILKPLSGWLTHEFPRVSSQESGIERIEPKLLDLSLMYFYEDRDNPRPGRILDAREVNPEDFDATRLTKERLFEELIKDEGGEPLLRRMVNKEGERRKSARKIVNRGVQNVQGEELIHVDYTAGTAFFDPKRGEGVFAVTSFKQGFLRLMQTDLLQTVLFHAGLLDQVKGNEFIRRIPANTMERIDYMLDWGTFDKNLISPRQIEEFKNNYRYFMQQYHRSEHAFVSTEATSVDFDKAEVANRRDDVIAFDSLIGRQFAKISKSASRK